MKLELERHEVTSTTTHLPAFATKRIESVYLDRDPIMITTQAGKRQRRFMSDRVIVRRYRYANGDEHRFITIEGRVVKADGSLSTVSTGRQSFFSDDEVPYPEIQALPIYSQMPEA